MQLIVLPEDSLINTEQYARSELIKDILEEMPSTQAGARLVNPCEETKDTAVVSAKESVLRTISCLASKHRMYIALSFGDKVPCTRQSEPACPDDGYFLYNSIGLFDEKGRFVAKYHKMQLYYEHHYNLPSECVAHPNPVTYFDSPFGRLGFLVCYDLMFRSPVIDLVEKHRVDTLVYSTYWFNYLPFVSAVQLQQAMAITHRVNFLAADVHLPADGTLGAGIFSGTRGALAYSNVPDGVSKLIIATIPCNANYPRAEEKCPPSAKQVVVFRTDKLPEYSNNHMNISLVKSIPLNHAFGQDFVQYCCPYSGICCSLYYRVRNVAQFNREHFVLLVGNVTSGALGQDRYPIRQEFCGLALCENSTCHSFATTSETKFASIDLTAKLKSKHIYPGVMTTTMELLPTKQWNFRTDKSSGQSVLSIRNAVKPLVAVTMYGRIYDQDPAYKH